MGSAESPLTQSPKPQGRAVPLLQAAAVAPEQLLSLPGEEGSCRSPPCAVCAGQEGGWVPSRSRDGPEDAGTSWVPAPSPRHAQYQERGPLCSALQREGGTRAGAKSTRQALHPSGMGAMCTPWLLSKTAAKGASCSGWPPPPAGLCHHAPTVLPSEGTAEQILRPSAFSWY